MTPTPLLHRAAFVALLLLHLAPAAFGQSRAEFVPGEVIVKFRPGALDTQLLESPDRVFDLGGEYLRSGAIGGSLRSAGALRIRRVVTRLRPWHTTSVARTGEVVPMPDAWNLFVVEAPLEADVRSLIAALEALPEVAFAEPNHILRLADEGGAVDLRVGPALPEVGAVGGTNDSRFGEQLSFENSTATNTDRDIDAARAWDFQTGNAGIKVCVIDSGIDYHHEDFGNAFGTSEAKVRGGRDFFSNDSDPDDNATGTTYHGTRVAGIIGAYRNNSLGVAGLAGGDVAAGNPGVQLFALKVSGYLYPNGYYTDDAALINAMYEGASASQGFGFGCHVLNASISGPRGGNGFTGPEFLALRMALSASPLNGATFVASAGNEEVPTLEYPAAFDPSWVIAVGATNADDARRFNSNQGSQIDVVAPGDESIILSTGGSPAPNAYFPICCTSAAAPHVSGLAALIHSEALEQGRTLHAEDVEGIIKHSAEKVRQDIYTYPNGRNDQMGHGRINAGRALELLQPPYTLSHRTTTGGTDQGALPVGDAVYILGVPGIAEGQLHQHGHTRCGRR